MTALAGDLAGSFLQRLDEALDAQADDADPLPALLEVLQRLCTEQSAFALYELIDGSRSDPDLARQVIEAWHELHARMVNRAAKLAWPVGTQRSDIDAVVFVTMRVWEAEARFRAVVGDASPVLDSTRQRITSILTAIFDQPLQIDWDVDTIAELDP